MGYLQLGKCVSVYSDYCTVILYTNVRGCEGLCGTAAHRLAVQGGGIAEHRKAVGGSDTAEHREVVEGAVAQPSTGRQWKVVTQPGSEVRWESESGHRA